MLDFCVFLAPLTYAYGAVGAGVLIARIALAWRSHHHQVPSVIEANWIALVPILAVVLLPIIVPLSFIPVPGLPSMLHRSGHQWEALLAQPPFVHVTLYVANVALLLSVVVNVVITLRGVIRAHHTLCALRMVSQRDQTRNTLCGLPVFIVPGDELLCFTAGLLRPVVFVSQGLIRLLNQDQRDVILAHEAAHGRRRDTMIGCMLAIFYGVFRVPGVNVLTAVWRSASERACDADAAKQCGSACKVAMVIVDIARLDIPCPRAIPTGAFSFGPSSGAELEVRVAALLELVGDKENVLSPYRQSTIFRSSSLTPALILGVFSADYVLQHLVEFFIVHRAFG